MTNETNEYDKQAQDFLDMTDTKFSVKFLKHDKYFEDDKDTRDIYKITLARANRHYTFTFGQSLAESGFKLISRNNKQEYKYLWLSEANKSHDLKQFKFALDRLQSLGSFEIVEPKTPRPYDVLAVLSKSDPGTFEEFCSEYGYDTDSRKAENIYHAVVDEWNNLKMLFTDDELDKLSEIN